MASLSTTCGAVARSLGPRREVAGAAWLAVLLLAAGACAARPEPRLPAADSPLAEPWGLAPGDGASQRLYRLRYDGPRGDGTLRLVLRLSGPARFQLDSSDALGRRLWSLRVDGAEALRVDHRRRSFCATASDIRLAELGLESLPLAAIPRVLLGRLPVEPVSGWTPGARRQRFRDARGRSWQARLEAGAPVSWTLRQGGRPYLWWSGRDGEGVLSHRAGTQFRWRETVREPLVDGLLDALAPPADYLRGVCDERDLSELGEDQPPPAGGGPP